MGSGWPFKMQCPHWTLPENEGAAGIERLGEGHLLLSFPGSVRGCLVTSISQPNHPLLVTQNSPAPSRVQRAAREVCRLHIPLWVDPRGDWCA